MLDEHMTPPVLKGKNLEELHKERMASKPDPWTLAWIKKQIDEVVKGYLGACHAINTAVMNTRDNREKLEAFEKRMKVLEDEHQMTMEKIGGMVVDAEMLLQRFNESEEEKAVLKKRMDGMADWAKKIESKNPKS